MWWFLLWLVFSVAVLTYMGWSANIVLAQRKAWREFATKYKLEYSLDGKGLLAPAAIAGTLQGRSMNVYAMADALEGARTERVYTYVEVFFNNPPPVPCVLSRRALPPVLADVNLPQTLSMPSPEWPKPAVAMTTDSYQLANWLSGRRLGAFKAFMDAAGRGDEPILVNNNGFSFILWRTDDPLRDPRQLNALVQKMYGWMKDMDTPDEGSSSKQP